MAYLAAKMSINGISCQPSGVSHLGAVFYSWRKLMASIWRQLAYNMSAWQQLMAWLK
jgi:hypothetical protein